MLKKFLLSVVMSSLLISPIQASYKNMVQCTTIFCLMVGTVGIFSFIERRDSDLKERRSKVALALFVLGVIGVAVEPMIGD